MNSPRRVGSRAPLMGLTAAVLALLLLPTLVLGADWTSLGRVSSDGGTRLDSLHQLAADNGRAHLVHPRIGSKTTDDRVVYQRSTDDGASWAKEKVLFAATNKHRHVVPNLALDARGNIVAVAWRVNGPDGSTLFARVSRNGGISWDGRREIFATAKDVGVGVPAIAVGKGVIAVTWTNRATGKIKLSLSRDDGRTYKEPTTLGSTKLSIDCREKLTDGLVGIAATEGALHVAWSYASKRSCIASSIKIRTSTDKGRSWDRRRSLTDRRTYGWPELDARGRTVLATVQAPSGGVVVARSTKNGRDWSDKLLKAAKGHSLSAADVVLLPGGKAMITYVDEALRKDKLVRTRVLSRRSPDNGVKWRSAQIVVPVDQALRMAPNIAADGKKVLLVVQSGQLDGSPRNIFSSRLR